MNHLVAARIDVKNKHSLDGTLFRIHHIKSHLAKIDNDSHDTDLMPSTTFYTESFLSSS